MGIFASVVVGQPGQQGALSSDVLLGTAGRAGAGAAAAASSSTHGWVLGDLLLSRTGSGQHGAAQDVHEGAAPGDEDGGPELKPGMRK